MEPTPVEATRKLTEYENPVYGYRRGKDGAIDSDIFDGEIPEGWCDSPANVDEIPEPSADGGDGDGDTEDSGGGEGLKPPYDEYGFNELRDELKRRTGKGPTPGTNTTELIAALTDLDAAA